MVLFSCETKNVLGELTLTEFWETVNTCFWFVMVESDSYGQVQMVDGVFD